MDNASVNPQHLRQQTASGVFWSISERIGSQAVSVLVFLVLANFLEPRHFGLVAITASFLDFVDLFLDQGFSSALVQRKHLEPEHLDTAFWINVVLGAALTVICLVVAPIVATIYREPILASITTVLALQILLRSLNSTQVALLRRAFRFKALAARSIITVVAGGLVGIVMAFSGFGVWSLVAQSIVASSLAVAVLWRVNQWRPRFRFSSRHWRELFSFGAHVTAYRFVWYFPRRTDDILIGFFLGPTVLGYYAVAYRVLQMLLSVLLQVIGTVALPTFSRLQDDNAEFRRTYVAIIRMISLVAFPIFVGVAWLAEPLTLVLFGNKWEPSAPVMRILACVGLVEVVGALAGTMLLAKGLPALRFQLAVVRSVLTILGFLIAVRFGISGMAISLLITTAITVPAMNAIVVKHVVGLSFRTQVEPHATPILASLVMLVCLMLIDPVFAHTNATIALAGSVLTGAAAYVVAVWVIKPQLVCQAFTLVRAAFSGPSLADNLV